MISNVLKCGPSGRMTGDERREQILRTAVDLFSRFGFSGTTTKEIARAAGVSEAMVFRHFSTKEELYGAILQNKSCHDGKHNFPWEWNPEIRRAVKENDDRAFFYNIAIQALENQQADGGFMRLLLYSALEEHEIADRFFNEFVSSVYEFIGNYVRTRQDDGAMRKIEPKIVVRTLLGMLIHHSLNNILWDKNRRLLDITNEAAASHFTDILLNGILVRTSNET